ncbi:MAG: malto-oligosyltrehalose trehalohydrolase [Candidatus Binataceae bacterium]
MNTRRLWAPFARKVELVVTRSRVPMDQNADGWWSCKLDGSAAHLDYTFSIDASDPIPDPRSLYQPYGVLGVSRPIDHSTFRWTDEGWRGPPLGSAIIYECHIGTFTEEGTFDAACERLQYLKNLGISHLELMPVAEFSGDRGWGYDGVDLYAPHHVYGGPDGMKRLVDACHRVGLGVILDVVYNHFGPCGNVLPTLGPYLTDCYHTPWGDAVNFDNAQSFEVRRLVCDNALMWLRDYHVDGLRLDAVHAIYDNSAIHILEQLATEVHALEAQLGRALLVIAESDLNQPRLVTSRDAGGYGLDAQWSDDFHHALHAYLTREQTGYYEDFGSLANVAKALASSYVYDGAYSRHRRRIHGRPGGLLPADRFIVCIQNHDQIGNRAAGERLGQLISPDRLKIAAALLMTSAFVPLIFQGEEWNASSPFQYFTDHKDPTLAEAVRQGRRKEFARFIGAAAEVPDPQAKETFARSKLRWDELEHGEHAGMLEWYRALIDYRRRHRPPLRLDQVGVEFDEAAMWLAMRSDSCEVLCNFSEAEIAVPLSNPRRTMRLALASRTPVDESAEALRMAPVSVAIFA